MNKQSPLSKSLSIAILGTRGIPARYGGFETFAEELSTRLKQNGHQITVFGRKFFGEKDLSDLDSQFYKGVRIVRTFSIRQKYLETPIHALTCNIWILWKILTRQEKFDAILLCNAANSPFAWMINFIPLVINVDGIERNRSKWNALGKLWYRLGEYCSVKFAHQVIGDADVICDYYKERFNCDAVMIPYGATANFRIAAQTLSEFNLIADNYILYVSRLEPENNALGVIQAYKKTQSNMPLVIVGDAPYADLYKQKLHNEAKGFNVIFTGFQFAERYHELQTNCFCYIQATEVGGTHPALIEAMAYGNAIIANGTPENIEVVKDACLVYEKNDFSDLGHKLQSLINFPELRLDLKNRAKDRANKQYSWSSVTYKYQELFTRLVRGT